jgi:ligand-binding sensor domain-containing protein/two-component sensor histidine kinase
MRKRGILLCLVAVALGHGERLPIKNYTTAEGMPHDSITCIRRDSNGYLWFCTPEGLGRFDGNRFVTYGPGQGLPDRGINDFREDRNGTYWIATNGGGVLQFRPAGGQKTVSEYRLSDRPGTNNVNCLFEDSSGRLWAGTDAGLFARAPGGGSFRSEIPDIHVLAILEDKRQTLWIATEVGLYRLPPAGVPELYDLKNSLNPPVVALMEDRAGRLWISTRGGVLLLAANPDPRHPLVVRKFGVRDGIPEGETWGLLETSDGRIWVCTLDGLAAFDGQRFRVYGTAQGLSVVAGSSALTEDREGNLWVGTLANGAMRLARGGFTSFHAPDGLEADTIYSIFADQAGRPCALTGGLRKLFLGCFDGRRFTPVHPNTPGDIGYFGWGIHQITFQDHAGEWWVATGQGLCRFPRVDRLEMLAHTRPKAIYTKSNGLAGNDVFRLFEDSRGDVWISTIEAGGSLVRWERKSESFFDYRNQQAGAVRNRAATAFGEDRAGNLWVAFFRGGLARYRGGRFDFIPPSDGAPPGMVLDLYSDAMGRLWAAGDSGLDLVNDPSAAHPRFVRYTSADGLASTRMTAVAEDRFGRIYAGSRRGLDRFDAATPPRPGHVVHLTVADGLASNFVQLAFRDRAGALWFGTQHGGLSRLVPQQDRPRQAPPVRIENVRIAGAPYSPPETGQTPAAPLRLGPGQNRLEIEFGGISFGAGEMLRYQYKLEGADEGWSAPSAQRVVNYANLAPGSYRFVVQALSAEDATSPTPASLSFIIDPPLWRRWWFLALFVLATAAVLVWAHYTSVARVLEVERMRTRIATDLHDDVGSGLTQIALLSDVLQRQVDGRDARVSERLERIAGVSRELVDSMSDIVWAISPRSDRCGDLAHRMRRFTTDVFTAGNIDFGFETIGADREIRLGADTRRQVYLILKECVNNVARHSGCTHASVRLEFERGWLTLNVDDDGRGFAMPDATGGHGLISMRARAKALNGEIRIASEAGDGCRIFLRVPIGARQS